jgi:hypothetical protein
MIILFWTDYESNCSEADKRHILPNLSYYFVRENYVPANTWHVSEQYGHMRFEWQGDRYFFWICDVTGMTSFTYDCTLKYGKAFRPQLNIRKPKFDGLAWHK